MLAMQYSIPLPADFSTEQVHARVKARAALFDDHAGLLHKSFIYSEEDHLYAPFYVWKNSESARNFLLDYLFKGVVDTFTRHRVRSWYVLNMVHGSKECVPTYAQRAIDPIPADEKLERFIAREQQAQAGLAQDPALCMHLLALDADRWEVMRYSLWHSQEAAQAHDQPDCAQGYQVLHVSEPV